MESARNTAASLLPDFARKWLREKHREMVLHRAMKEFMRDPASAIEGSHVLQELVYGWGNEGWSAQNEYLAFCLGKALESQGAILECGSGLSTMLVAQIAKKRGLQYWALEHIPSWAERVRGAMHRYGMENIHVSVAPLKDYGGFSWYQPPLEAMPATFGLVICDGPPDTTPGGRYGLLPVMRQRLGAGTIIVLDDAEREAELAIAHRWGKELDAKVRILGTVKPYAEIRVSPQL